MRPVRVWRVWTQRPSFILPLVLLVTRTNERQCSMTVDYNTWKRDLCLASAWCVIKISAKTKARLEQWNMSQVFTLMSLYLTTDTSFVSRSVLWIHECQIEVQHLSFFTLSLSDSLFHGFWWCFSCSLLIHECKMTCVLINIIRHVTQAHGTHLRTAASLAFLFNIRILRTSHCIHGSTSKTSSGSEEKPQLSLLVTSSTTAINVHYIK